MFWVEFYQIFQVVVVDEKMVWMRRSYRDAMGRKAAEQADENLPQEVVSMHLEEVKKDKDFTFSLGRYTNRREVGNLICRSGAIGSFEDFLSNFRLTIMQLKMGRLKPLATVRT